MEPGQSLLSRYSQGHTTKAAALQRRLVLFALCLGDVEAGFEERKGRGHTGTCQGANRKAKCLYMCCDLVEK